MTALKLIAFLLLGFGAFLVYGARYVAAKLDKGKNEQGGEPERSISPDLTEPLDEDEQKALQKIPSRMVLNVKMAGMIFILAGGILVLVTFK